MRPLQMPHFTLPLIYQRREYGNLYLAPSPLQPSHPAIPFPRAALLAENIAFVWHSFEQTYILYHLTRRLPAAPLASLTPAEQTITALMASGLSDEEIAAFLKRQKATIAKHSEHIRDKLDVHSRVNTILSAYHHHLVSLSDYPDTLYSDTDPLRLEP